MQVVIANGDLALGSVLILEDEGLVAMMMEDAVRELGVERVEVCPDTASALALLAVQDFDCAILDVRLRDGSSGRVADELARRGIPFLFSTGSGLDGVAAAHRSRPLINKPFADEDFKQKVLDTVVARRMGPRLGDVVERARVATAVASD